MDKSKINTLLKHISVLEKAYENIVKVMKEDVEMIETDEGKKVALKDEKIKTYAQGLKESAETLNYLFEQLELKRKELADLRGEKVEIKKSQDTLNKHLE